MIHLMSVGPLPPPFLKTPSASVYITLVQLAALAKLSPINIKPLFLHSHKGVVGHQIYTDLYFRQNLFAN